MRSIIRSMPVDEVLFETTFEAIDLEVRRCRKPGAIRRVARKAWRELKRRPDAEVVEGMAAFGVWMESMLSEYYERGVEDGKAMAREGGDHAER